MTLCSLSFACNGEDFPLPEPKIASYYAEPFHGRLTASGYIYDMNDMTAASMEYKFGSVVRVTNRRNGKYVDVVITDNGSFKEKYGRHIDLSKAAFAKLDKLGYGLLEVDTVLIDDSKQFRYKHGGKKFDRERYGI
ncbi:MAG: septal ring lytic transglycosylase RlpA family protein [Cetobacterium sp.]|uniref:septal ring lytic transglycosylase RlpA family protein n=1 Tax=Cetobacterium sp. TaxID=2071632 RepID=UPI003F3FDE03